MPEEDDLATKVQAALGRIRPQLQAHGGDVEYVGIEDATVKVRLQGACAGCPMAQMTLKQGIEAYLKEELPEVAGVEQVA